MLFFFLLSGMLSTYAQTTADTQKAMIKQFMRFPVNVRLSQDFVSAGDYRMKDINKGSFSEAFMTNLNFTMPVYKGNLGFVTVGACYNYHNLKFSPNRVDEASWHPNMGREHHTWGLQSAYILTSKLWGKQFNGIFNVKGEFSEQGLGRVTGVAMGLLQIVKTEYTSLGVGAILLVNTYSQWPLFPIATYRHKFDEEWSLDLMPPRFYVNYIISRKDKLSAGFSIFGEHFYVTPEREELPKTCMYARSNIRPELVYERNITNLAKFFIKSGVAICISSRLYSNSGRTKYVRIYQDPSFFLQAGVSYGVSVF